MDVQAALTRCGSVWTTAVSKPEVCVAVLDGPVDLSHPCFDGADIRRLDTLVQDPAGNGPMSVHGTHVASLIFGQPGSPVTGIAPRCRGLVAPVFRDSGQRHLSQLDLARAIEQAVQEGAHVINISGGQQSPEGQAEGMLERALQLCEDSNVLVVAAVGNDGCACLHVPAAVPSVLGVGALGADGKPLETSNWGEAYQSNGILAPGEGIKGAAPGGGTVSLTGSSFATPIVSGVAALLLSTQVQGGRPPSPRAVGASILAAARPCRPRDSPECRRYLVGTLNIPGAYASVTKGGKRTMTGVNTTEAANPAVSSATPGADNEAAGTSLAGLAAAGSGPPAEAAAATVPGATARAPEPGITAACDEPAAQPAASQTAGRPAGASVATREDPPAPAYPSVSPARAPADGIVAAAGCGCEGAAKSYIFAIGSIGFDFGTEARRDTFRQLMPRPQRGEPPVSVPPNPYDVLQLADYLDENKSESTKLIWTLNLDLTPIYAMEAELTYAEDVYEVFRGALRNQALPVDDENYVSRVSIPGVLTGKTMRLFSGQVLPVVRVQHRGLFCWRETQLVDELIPEVTQMQPDATEQWARETLRTFLDKVYYQLRNLGQTSPDRALNFVATNAFTFATGIRSGLISSTHVPGGTNLYTLDTISVSKSPYCRMDSDCWDVKVTFFDPENDRRARAVYLYTVDVSDEMPVSLAPTHEFLVASP